MSIMTVIVTCLWFLLVSSFTCANKADVYCLRDIYSKVKDPKGYLTSWVFANKTAGYICDFSGVTCWHNNENRVLSINLSGYGLEGEFPSGIMYCTGLVDLDLSRNNFYGALPSNMASLVPFLTALDLSYNQFSGEIPASLSDIKFLNILNLQHNQFTCQLPPELASLPRLRMFSVEDNSLTGPIPRFNETTMSIGPDNFANNEGLCGRPVDACVDPEEEVIRLGKMGAAVGAALFGPLAVFLDWFVFNGRKKKRGGIRHRSLIFHVRD